MAEAEGISEAEARRTIAKQIMPFQRRKSCQPVEATHPAPEAEPEDEMVHADLPPEFIPAWNGSKMRMPSYLKQRGFEQRIVKAWGLGYCQSGRYSGRVVIPIKCPAGSSFTARDATGVQQPRYLNPKDTDHGSLLFGWPSIGKRPVFIVEGPLDALKMIQHGYSAVAVLGKVLHANQLMQLRALPRDKAIIVMLDPEEYVAPFKAATQLVCLFHSLYVCRLREGIDPGASSPEDVAEAIDSMQRFSGDKTELLKHKLKQIKVL